MAKRRSSFFWASFTDLMISLFFLMLVLFAILNRERQIYQEDAKYLMDLKKIDEQIEALEESGFFKYEQKYKRHLLTKEVTFDAGQYIIRRWQDQEYLVNVGKAIDRLVESQQSDSVQYLIIIEGMASKSGGLDENYDLSYKRAYEVYKLWKQRAKYGIISFVENTEVLIAGSGEGGVGRYTGNDDEKNQRFLIQVIPKVQIQTTVPIDSVKYDNREN